MAINLLDKKIEYWQHQLLDLGKRNKMINYRETKRSTLKLVEPAFNDFYNKIAVNEEVLTFQRSIDRETDIRVFSVLSLLEHLESPLPITIGDIKADGSILDRQRTLKHMRNKFRLAQEEQGTHILYLSFGFVEWRDGKGASARVVKSPLILVPVVLALDSLNSPYTLTKHEDDIVLNPTLVYFFKTEYGVELPSFDADKDSLEDYLTNLEGIADQRGWRIVREVSLGLLSFLKITMYNDLLINEERIKNNPVIRAMAGDPTDINDIPDEITEFDLDSIKPQDCFQVMNADSSQQDAVLYSKNNISFVMQGPPGTGKSQTITNIIAEALADGKKVLFVSEKMAALQVVYRRLQEAHLAEFCLPLHSYKANKKEILEQIGANLKLKQTRVKDTAINSLEELLTIRQELNKYALELHEPNPNLNLSCYEVYSKLSELIDIPAVTFKMDDSLDVSQADLQVYLNILKEYSLSISRLKFFIKNNPWDGLSTLTVGHEYSARIQSELNKLNSNLLSIKEIASNILMCAELTDTLKYDEVPQLADIVKNISELPEIPTVWLDEFDFTKAVSDAKEGREYYSKMISFKNDIDVVFEDGVYEFAYIDWQKQLLLLTDKVSELPLISEKSSDYYAVNFSILMNAFNVLKEKFVVADDAFSEINETLGTDFIANPCNRQKISDILSAIEANIILPENWFENDFNKFRAVIKNGEAISSEINSCEKKLLAEWESEILTFDYSSILLRYKTDYTSVFKVFNSKYHSDRKQIRALSKSIIKKLSDDTVVNLLNTLKTYHEKEKAFDNIKTELAAILDKYFIGKDSDWNAISKAFDTAEKIKAIFDNKVPARLIELFSSDHKIQSETLQKLHERFEKSMTDAAEAISDTDICINADDSKFDLSEIIEITTKYISALNEVSVQKSVIVPYLKNAEETIEIVFSCINKLNSYMELKKLIALKSSDYIYQFDFLYTESSTDWDRIITLLEKTSVIKQSHLFMPVRSVFEISDRNSVLFDVSKQLTEVFNSGYDCYKWLESQFNTDTFFKNASIDSLKNKINACIENIDLLEPWIDYQEAKADCANNKLGEFISKIEEAEYYEEIEKIFLKSFYTMWLGAVCDRSGSVRRFRRNTQDERIEKFIELDELQLLIAQMRIREKLIENLPSGNRLLKATDEVAILNKELTKKRKIMPLRKLFRLIPNLLLKLKPCLMMSPLSVSYFLETEAYHFDLVIFDEASQIFPEDAIGAIFRGSQVIIAGDSKQLPPTSFFASSTNNFDGDYDTNDEDDYSEIVSDSILEEATAVLPNRTLLWHYRSKHEGLIAFSNREIYKNNLITFPNSVNNVPDMGVEYIYVEDGYYEGSGKNCNIREAQKCVMLVIEHIQNHPDRSLGIIAFSEKQQAAIENAIIDFRERSPEYEWFFAESKEEPFFVKNLENVQGDERDTIIFSICYAKDQNGRMYMRFGPLGHDGGERRLNVAITRAKCNIKLVGSILPSDIDLNRTNSEGVRMLRSYIEFARKGTIALKPVEKETDFNSTDEFCEIIACFLENNGYKVQRHVGCSDYKIDIAVENPDVEGEFIAGIECDGISYAQARTARDRDHLRKTILENMGWNLYRVWSTEWYRNPTKESEALISFIESLFDKADGTVHSIECSNNDDQETKIEDIASETEKNDTEKSLKNPYNFSYYEEANWWDTVHSGSHDNLTRIGENILYIVGVEEPMHMELLYKRMGPSFTTGKATEAVKSTIDEAIKKKLAGKVVIDNDNFIRLVPLNPLKVRIPKEYDTPRPMEYIMTEEVSLAMIQIINNSFGISEEDLASECARVFGFERKGPKIKAKTDAAITLLIKNNKIKIIDGKVNLINT